MPYELFLTTSEKKTKIKNAFVTTMSSDIKLSKAQLFKTIQSNGFLHDMLCILDNLGKSMIKKLGVPLGNTFCQD